LLNVKSFLQLFLDCSVTQQEGGYGSNSAVGIKPNNCLGYVLQRVVLEAASEKYPSAGSAAGVSLRGNHEYAAA
tara:strand:+ start:2806 stop:3027 length:222 start_codon:yes stop_codon:yes gene_type:complete